MKIGFAREDITPRVGVPLCGFGPFLNRYSVGIRDRLWARAMAFEHEQTRAVIVSCDLASVSLEHTTRARGIVTDAVGLPAEAMMVNCTHTHSGPDTSRDRIGWGGVDEPYMQLLPHRIARAAAKAVMGLRPATLAHAEVPCEGIGLNREYDRDAPPLEEVLKDDWRPAKPELTDTTCHVVKAEAGGRLLGFFSYFGCHPVCCCQETHQTHGDYAGVATSMLEREYPGSVGLFLQGASGDVNSCVVHKPEQEAMLALDIIAGRYANSVRDGLRKAEPVEVDALRFVLREVRFTRKESDPAALRARLAEQEAILAAPDATDSDSGLRMAAVFAVGLRRLIGAMERGEPLNKPAQLHGIRIGPITLLGSPFEVFQA
ncbi:MAG: neutral/alkaline non-lysosomal ceramidase N-terminal domain-containing protein, partial [Candidatus Brocadiae bacterium]|nr:neutral/alkaline non-lysosomal ceramidase N-terminal domain-containing protein [Candidatus Brocadiia bacterium]